MSKIFICFVLIIKVIFDFIGVEIGFEFGDTIVFING